MILFYLNIYHKKHCTKLMKDIFGNEIEIMSKIVLDN